MEPELQRIAHPHVLVQGPEITKLRSCRAALQSQRKAQGPQFDTLQPLDSLGVQGNFNQSHPLKMSTKQIYRASA